MRESMLIVAAAGLLAACGTPEPAGDEAAPTANEALPAETPSAPQTATEIPLAFRGVYDSSLEGCSRPSENRLTVSAGELRFHESIGAAREVAVKGSSEIRVTSDFQGEGESWRAAHDLRLGDGGATLTIVGKGTNLTRVRCPSAAPASAPETLYWGSEGSSGGGEAALVLTGADGKLRLTLACRPGSGELVVNVPAFRPVASEERMTFGAGGTAVTLVADPRGDARRGGVTGRGPVPPELAGILAAKDGIAVNYSSQDSGPHPEVPARHARYLVQSCGG